MPDPLSTDCPARKLARDFIFKFKQDSGEMRSLKKLDLAKKSVNPRRSKRVKFTPDLATPPPWTPREFRSEFYVSRTYGIRGQCGNCFIRWRMEECQIGDVVPCASSDRSFPPGLDDVQILMPVQFPYNAGDFTTELKPIPMEVLDLMRFRKVSCELTSDNGRTWQTCWFWKRVG